MPVVSKGFTGEAHNVIKEALLLLSNSNLNLQQLLKDDTTNGLPPDNLKRVNALFYFSANTNTNPDSSKNTANQNNKKTPSAPVCPKNCRCSSANMEPPSMIAR